MAGHEGGYRGVATCCERVSYFESPNAGLFFSRSLFIKCLIFYSKTNEDFISAPETFKFEDRDWILKLGWERYDKSAPAKDRQKPKSKMTLRERYWKL